MMAGQILELAATITSAKSDTKVLQEHEHHIVTILVSRQKICFYLRKQFELIKYSLLFISSRFMSFIYI